MFLLTQILKPSLQHALWPVSLGRSRVQHVMLSLLELRVIGGEKVLGAQVGKSNDNLFAKIAWWSKSLEGKQRGFQSRVQSDDCCWPMSWQCRHFDSRRTQTASEGSPDTAGRNPKAMGQVSMPKLRNIPANEIVEGYRKVEKNAGDNQ